MGKDKLGFGLAGCGGLLTFGAFASFLFWAFNTWIEPGGAISADEAFPGVLGSCCCGMITLGITAAGIVVAVQAKRKAAQAPSQPQA